MPAAQRHSQSLGAKTPQGPARTSGGTCVRTSASPAPSAVLLWAPRDGPQQHGEQDPNTLLSGKGHCASGSSIDLLLRPVIDEQVSSLTIAKSALLCPTRGRD